MPDFGWVVTNNGMQTNLHNLPKLLVKNDLHEKGRIRPCTDASANANAIDNVGR